MYLPFNVNIIRLIYINLKKKFKLKKVILHRFFFTLLLNQTLRFFISILMACRMDLECETTRDGYLKCVLDRVEHSG